MFKEQIFLLELFLPFFKENSILIVLVEDVIIKVPPLIFQE